MSHFKVLLLTNEYPTKEVISNKMMPFHEFESTGIDNEYVVTQDVTEEKISEYNSSTIRVLTDANDVHHSYYDDMFYRPWSKAEEEKYKDSMLYGIGIHDGRSYTTKYDGDNRVVYFHVVPDGFVEQRIGVNKLYEFEEWLAGDGYSKIEGDVKLFSGPSSYYVRDAAGTITVFRRTNPNSKWDWYSIGGRYENQLVANDVGQCNIAKRGDLRLNSMHIQNKAIRIAAVDAVCEIIGCDVAYVDHCLKVLRVTRDEWDKGENGPFRQFLKERVTADEEKTLARVEWGMWDYEEYSDTQSWIDASRAITTWSVIDLNGEWSSRGDMGWFGASSNDVDSLSKWQDSVEKLIEDLPDDVYVTVVDCHI